MGVDVFHGMGNGLESGPCPQRGTEKREVGVGGVCFLLNLVILSVRERTF